MATYRPDLGGVFDSDVHRRVLAALPAPDAVPVALEYAAEPIAADENLPFHVVSDETLSDIKQVVEDLLADGFVTFDEETGEVQRASTGTNALEEPDPNAPPALTDEEVAEREAQNAEKATADQLRQVQGRLEANRSALEELQAAIADDEAFVAEHS